MPRETIKVRQQTINFDFEEDLRINRTDLNDEFANQPRLFAKWAALAIEARYEMERAKSLIDLRKAEVDAAFRSANSGGRITERVVEVAVETSLIVRTAIEGYLEARRVCGICEAAETAFSQRKDMLKELGQNQRAELSIDPNERVAILQRRFENK